jgi:hypothetical protein
MANSNRRRERSKWKDRSWRYEQLKT